MFFNNNKKSLLTTGNVLLQLVGIVLVEVTSYITEKVFRLFDVNCVSFLFGLSPVQGRCGWLYTGILSNAPPPQKKSNAKGGKCARVTSRQKGKVKVAEPNGLFFFFIFIFYFFFFFAPAPVFIKFRLRLQLVHVKNKI